MDSNFAKCLTFVLKEEGGNDDDPNDHGGRTSRGITQREYNAYCKVAGLQTGDVWKAPQEVIDSIYNKSYWHPYCPTLPIGVDLVFFDECVNAGPGEAAKVLQHALGVAADGHIGMVTSQALTEQSANLADTKSLIERMTTARLAYYRSLRQFSRYGKGWTGRARRCQTAAVQLLLEG